MEAIDDELKKGLADEPLTKNGFSDALRKRIGERLDEKKSTSRQWMPWFGGISAALLATAVFLSLDGYTMLRQSPAGGLESQRPVQESSAPSQFESGERQVRVQSAVLLGLRTDYPQAGGWDYSTYRTVMLANDQGQLQKIAEGDGILMPYRTDFMRISPQSLVISKEEYRVLGASPAIESSKSQMTNPAKSSGSLKLSEKLLFAGNRYLSVAQTIRQNTQGKESQQEEYIWVKDLRDIANNKPEALKNPALAPHVSMKSLYGDSIQSRLGTLNPGKKQSSGNTASARSAADNGESWAIVRKQGKWVPQLAAYMSQGSLKFQLQDVPIDLPDSVVSYDRLTTDWNEIVRLVPDAKDAFSSPNHELLGIVSDKHISVYASEGQLSRNPLLTLGLEPNESIVMIQWAVDEPYIEMWKEKGKKLLGY